MLRIVIKSLAVIAFMSLDLGPQCSAGNNEAETRTAVEISALLYKTYAPKLSQYVDTKGEINDVELDKLLENCGLAKNEKTKQFFSEKIRAVDQSRKDIENIIEAYKLKQDKHKKNLSSPEALVDYVTIEKVAQENLANLKDVRDKLAEYIQKHSNSDPDVINTLIPKVPEAHNGQPSTS